MMRTKRIRLMLRTIPFLLAAVFLGTCSTTPPLIDQIKTLGELRVVTRTSATTYYEGAAGPQGLEYDLAWRFAEHLGVELNMYALDSFADVLPEVAQGRAHLAAAGVSVTGPRKRLYRFSEPYQEVTQQLIYRYRTQPPDSLDDFVGKTLHIVADSSHADQLERLKAYHPELTWYEDPQADAAELIARVMNGEADYTVADSNEVLVTRFFYPEMRVAFDLKVPEPIAWAFNRGDDSVAVLADAFISDLEERGELDHIKERYFGHVDRFDYVGTRLFMRHIDARLPTYRQLYEDAAKQTGADWRLLAAIGYQESHRNPNAVSPTGVRGIMMLTQATARQLGVDNRIDPGESIFGGARYFLQLKEKIPSRIPEPDRTWLALAAYNVGFGHLEDARRLTETNGKNSDRWVDVREHLPLLSQRKWYSTVRHGYARGWEPVVYVDNIRSYYDTLSWVAADSELIAREDEQIPEET